MDGSVMWAILDFFSVIVVWSDDFIFEVAGLFGIMCGGHNKCKSTEIDGKITFQQFMQANCGDL